MLKKICAVLMAACLLLSLGACGENKKTEKAVAIATENFSFDEGELAYLYGIMYNQYYMYAMYYGLDVMSLTRNYAKTALVFCEAAKAEGMELTEEDENVIKEMYETIKEDAEKESVSVDEYIADTFGAKADYSSIEGVQRKMMLYENYYVKYVDSVTYTEADINAEYAANQQKYDVIDYVFVTLNGDGIAEDVTKKAVERFKTAVSYEDFTAATKEFISEAVAAETVEEGGGIDAYTEKILKDNTVTGENYYDDDYGNWSFASGRSDGDIYVLEDAETPTYCAFYLLKTPYRSEAYTVDVRHILFKIDETAYATAAEARAKAEEIYLTWVNSGAKEEQFIELCKEYSGDSNASTGGLYTGVNPGDMVETFNDWCFDPVREYGDHGIVDTKYGSHMMFFVGKNISWSTAIEEELRSALYSDLLKQMQDKYPVTEHEDVIAGVTETPSTAASEAAK